MTQSTQPVTWILVIVGWWLVNRQNNIREKRKEIRALLDKMQSALDEIETQAIKYHTNPKDDDLAFALKRSLTKKFPNKLAILTLRKLDVKKCYECLKMLRKAITMNNFDTSSHTVLTTSDKLIRNIWVAKEDLSQELEKSFVKKYA